MSTSSQVNFQGFRKMIFGGPKRPSHKMREDADSSQILQEKVLENILHFLSLHREKGFPHIKIDDATVKSAIKERWDDLLKGEKNPDRDQGELIRICKAITRRIISASRDSGRRK